MSDKRARYLRRRKKKLNSKRKAAQPTRKVERVEAPGKEDFVFSSEGADTKGASCTPLGKEPRAREREEPEEGTKSLASYLGFLTRFGSVLAKGAIVCLAAVGLLNMGSGSSDSAFTLSFKKDGAIVDLTVDVRSSEKTLSDAGITLDDLARIRSIARGVIDEQGLGEVVPEGMTLIDDEATEGSPPADIPEGLLRLYLNRLEIVEP